MTTYALLALCLLMGVSAVPLASESVSNRGENRARIEPDGFIYGGAIGVNQEIYTDYERRVIPLPVIGYRGEKLLVFGPFVNYQMFRSGDFSFDVRLSPRFGGFDESDSDIFRGMEEREFSMDLGFGVKYQNDNWKLELTGLRDLLNRSNGQEVSASLGKVFRLGPMFVEPAIGLSYLDNQHVDYYYGVDPSEAASFRPAYSGDRALNRSLSLNLVTPVFFDGLTRIGIENTWFDSTISDSPLTDADSSLSIFIAFSKFFDQ